MSAGDRNFSIGLCEVGDCKSCMYAWCCTQCALASSRNALDGSSWCFNLFCLPSAPYRWQVRSAYGIGDTTKCCYDDCMMACCCPCCSANQLYQTTNSLGNPTSDGGLQFNTGKMTSEMGCDCLSCLKTCFCMCCVVGDIVQNSYGMPWYLGCCCVDIFYARNTVRYHYRLNTTTGANECMEECLVPYVFYCLISTITSAFPGLQPIAYCQWVALVSVAMNLNQEVKIKSPGNVSKGYLVGYSGGQPAPQVGTVIEMVEPAGIVKA